MPAAAQRIIEAREDRMTRGIVGGVDQGAAQCQRRRRVVVVPIAPRDKGAAQFGGGAAFRIRRGESLHGDRVVLTTEREAAVEFRQE